MKIKKNMICWLLTVVLTFCMAVTPAYATSTNIYSVGGPQNMAVDGNGNIYVVNGGNSILKMNSSGALLATMRPVTDGQLYGVTVDSGGNIYVTDHKYKRVVKVTSSGKADDYISMDLSDPYGLAVDGNGTIFVADIGLRKIVRRDTSGKVTKIGTLSQPYDVAVKNNERIYVADNGANNIKELGSADGGQAAVFTGFSHPTGVAVDGKGNIYVADTYNNAVKKIDTSHNITTLASDLNMPWAVTVDSIGKFVYIGDTGNDVIKKVGVQIDPAVSVTSSQKYAPYGTTVTLTASLPSNATGTVEFIGAVNFGTATVSNGTASCQTSSSLAAGKYYVRAMYSGDDIYNSCLSDFTQLYITTGIESATISGLAVKGETLTADLLPADATATYIWKTSTSKDGNYGAAGSSSSLNKSKTYIPVNVDRNKYIKVEVTGSVYYTGSVTSEAIGPISYALEAPSITSKNAATFGVGTNGMFTVMAGGGPKPILSVGGATLPAGVTFTDNNDGTATLTGTPEAGTAGNYTFTIMASNTVGTDASQEFTLTVTDSTQVAVTDVTLDNSTMNLIEGTSGKLNATVNPIASTNKNLIWSTDDEDVATVDSDGEVTAVAEGTAIITVTTEDGSKKATCTVTVTKDVVVVTDATLESITAPNAITGVANATAKTDTALGLPSTVTLVTDKGNAQASVTWELDLCNYEPDDTGEQLFTVHGTITLPDGVVNTNNVDLNVTIGVTVNASASTDKTLVSITPPDAIIGVANATAKTDTALGLPYTVVMVTNDGNVQTSVAWDVDSCNYVQEYTTEQTFTVDGTAILPDGVVNTNNVDLDVIINVTVNAVASTDKTLVSITTPDPITGLANSTAKTNSALGLPSTVTLVTDDGNVQANVAWDMDSCNYNPHDKHAQTFTIDGTVTLPDGVVNTNNVPLTTSISVSVKKHSSSGGGSSSSDDSPSDESSSTVGNSSLTAANDKVTATPVTNHIAVAIVTDKQIADMVEAAFDKAEGQNAQATVEIGVNTDSDATGISVAIAQEAVSAMADGGINLLTISSPVVTLTFDEKALHEISKNMNGDIIITAVKPDDAALSDEDKAIIGNRPVYDLKITSGDTTISSFGGGTVTVSVPYTPGAGEDTSKIVVYYISGMGELIMVPNCIYDIATGTVIFKTTHFSAYAIGYNDVSFSDVLGEYEKSINFLNARGIINGTGEGKFSPNANITRAELVTILANLSGEDLNGYTTTSFKDVVTNDWYFEAVEWAYENGITAGMDGKFAPNMNINSEQMVVMLYNYARYAGLDVSDEAGMSIREFTNYESISNWATIPIQWAVNNSLISVNSDGSFDPAKYATRVQAAESIALLLNDMVK